MSRIVVGLTDPPVPFGNAAARWFYVLLRGLADRGHDVAAFASFDDPAQADEARALFPAPDYDLRLFPRPAPAGRGALGKLDSLRRPHSSLYGPDYRRALRDELGRGFDLLHLEHQWGGYLGLGHEERAVIHVHYLLRVDHSTIVATTLRERMLGAARLRAEVRLLRRYPNITTLTPRLTAEVRRISPGATVETVPLGMDLSLYPFEPDGGGGDAGPVVGLIGSFNWQATYSAGVRLLTRLWPEIRRAVPGARLRIVGRAARTSLGNLIDAPGVEAFEDVPDTVPYFRATDVLLYAPGPATGMKVKVMEAFALGVPVVTNTDGAEGLPVVDGVHAGLAEDDAGLIERTAALLRDADLRRQRRRAARGLLESVCQPEPVLDRLEAVHAGILARAESRPCAPTRRSASSAS